ncbi:hypothetical protein [Nocardioides sp.]|uniref:hypothetical protein n=1 Tax=Nocardioides sp. TaxID=35761 RepID=UPI00260F0D75|nr:hypothetical protein [Nocardioides sp.]MDI6910463.1 hypothetical protein [Nocardioides sp.]
MPTFEDPAADADEAQQALRGLAHATRSIHDPTDIYSTLGSLSRAAASMSQSLHQLASFHDGPSRKTGWAPEDSAGARSAAYRVSWELHRAAEMLRQVGETIDHAHEAEAILAYHREFPDQFQSTAPVAENRIGL